MKGIKGKGGVAALIVSIIALVVAATGVSSANVNSGPKQVITRATTAAAAGPTTKTFSFIGKPGSKTSTLVNVDQFLINARCGTGGQPVIFAFSSASQGDIFGHILDGQGRWHLLHNTSFSKGTKGVSVSTSSGDFDASGNLMFESGAGKVVTVNYAFDNATTLNKQNVCTVFGSVTAT
jgi:hypothetical protein